MRHFCFTLFGLLLLLTTACGPKVYEAPGAASTAAAHSIIAIVPPVVTIQGRKKDDPEQLKEAALADSKNFQQEIYSWMLRRKTQGRIRGLEIMDPTTTNTKLERAGYTLKERSLTPAEIAEALGVDGVIMSDFKTTKPLSEGAAVALGVLFGVWGATNETSVNMSVHDADSGMIWNYDWTSSGTFSSSEQLVDGLMRNASKRMPYTVSR